MSFARFTTRRGDLIAIEVESVVAIYPGFYGATVVFADGEKLEVVDHQVGDVAKEIERVQKQDAIDQSDDA